jgi:serine/threonine protein phosphatase 1
VYWVIGDIHGMARPLEALLSAISRRDPAAHFVFVGDYVNRGIESRRVIDLLLTLSDATFLRGNHDDILDLLLHGTCFISHPSAPDGLSAFVWFIQHGLAETLMSYGADWAELDWIGRKPSPRAVEQCLSIVPENHRRFIRALKPYFETADFLVIHGYWDPDDSDDSAIIAARLESEPQLRYRMLWWRFTEQQITRKKKWKRTCYFGHTPVFNYRSAGTDFVPIRGEKMVLLDTAIALCPAGNLSAVCDESGTVLQSSRAGEIIELQ